jgi:hypothetical protein
LAFRPLFVTGAGFAAGFVTALCGTPAVAFATGFDASLSPGLAFGFNTGFSTPSSAAGETAGFEEGVA